MDFQRTHRLLRARMRRRKRKEKVFKVSKTRITALWAQSFKKYGLPHQPLHTLRHTGPSRDVYIGYRTLFDVKKRGRWRGKEGVERYSKVHVYVKALSHLNPSLLARGQALLAAWGTRPAQPRQ